ncbi:MAG: hypothetical protein WC824_00235 [Bacteroidota bacterium]|jgi:hypothetical protein
MSESNDIKMVDGDVPFEPKRLLQDLRAMPKVSAPMDFSYHLTETLSQMDTEAALPWWKRFFRPAADGGFRIPALAYGTAAVMAVMLVSVYVISVTDFQREIQQQFKPGQSATEEAPATSTPKREADGRSPQDANQIPSSLVPSETDRLSRQSQPDVKIERNEQSIRPKLKDAPPTNLEEKSESKSSRSIVAPAAPSLPQVKSEEQLEFRTRGFLDEEQKIPVAKGMVSDSVRKLDSLRRLKKDNLPKPSSDPR